LSTDRVFASGEGSGDGEGVAWGGDDTPQAVRARTQIQQKIFFIYIINISLWEARGIPDSFYTY
jgi:hypothetical protein